MIKNYPNTDKQMAIKLKTILKKNYTPVENVDDASLSSNQSDSQADFIALRIIDNLIRFNQSYRFSQVAIKANLGKYNKKLVGGVYETNELDKNNIQYFSKQPSKYYIKHGDVWLHRLDFKKLKEKEVKDKVEINNTLQHIIDNVETNDKAAKKEEASTKIKNAMLTKGWVTRKSPNI